MNTVNKKYGVKLWINATFIEIDKMTTQSLVGLTQKATKTDQIDGVESSKSLRQNNAMFVSPGKTTKEQSGKSKLTT